MAFFGGRRMKKAWIVSVSVVFFAGLCFCITDEAGTDWKAGLDIFKWRSLGPSLFGGRITDIAVSPDSHNPVIYCAAATGGVWKSANQGMTWEPVFDSRSTGSIGCLALDPNDPSVIWVGTGEVIAGSHASWGDGIYKSEDGGRSWSHMGLKNSHYIGKIIVHPHNSEVVYAAAVGHLWGANPERGLYKTRDGGRSWNKCLEINDKVGVVDAVMDPSDPDVLYASSYGRMRGPFSTQDPVILPGGGIFKTADGGKTWTRLTEGLPQNRAGRIGLAVAPVHNQTVYAVIERAPFEVNLNAAQMQMVRRVLSSKSKPDARTVEMLRKIINKSVPAEEKDAAVVAGLSRARKAQLRSLLGWKPLDTGGGIFRSDDRGRSWKRMSASPSGAAFYSRIYVNPHDDETVYVPMQRMWISKDGGRNFKQAGWAFSSWLTSRYIHGDFHPFWINPEDPRHFLAGTDGGLYSSYDGGDTWQAHHMPIGQFYTVTVDTRRPYYVWGGTQDNGGWAGPSAVRHITGISNYEWFKFEESDGGYVQVDPSDPMTVYSEWQYGRIRRLDLRTGSWTPIQPESPEGEEPLRFHFIAPFLISPHDSDTLYMGAQRVMKSTDQGENWIPVSGDLTLAGRLPTISTLSESPLTPGVLYAGTEDGRVQVTRDGGKNWMDAAKNIPGMNSENLYVSRVEASHSNPGTGYVSFDGHYRDDFGVYLFKTEDYGQSWKDISGNLPSGHPVRVIREDPGNPSLLFAGTSSGVWMSLNSGKYWIELKNGFPKVRVDDLAVHARDADLVAGTHGRGIYVLDISPLREMTSRVLDSDLFLIPVQPAVLWNLDVTKNKGARGDRWFAAENPYSELLDLMTARYVIGEGGELAPPGASVYYYIKDGAPGLAAECIILDDQGQKIRRLTGTAEKGLNRILWDLREASLSPPPSWSLEGGNDAVRLGREGRIQEPGPLVKPGIYKIRLKLGDKTREKNIRVFKDSYVSF